MTQLLLFLFALAAPLSAVAGPALPAIVTGTVTDAATGEALIGAAVRIEGTSQGAATDLDGTYRLPSVPSGPQTLLVTYVGYREQRIEIDVPARGTRQLDVQLELDVVQGAEVVVSAQAEGQVAAINQQLRSNQIVSVVSAARLRELPDANAAESVGRLPGISIQRDAGEGQRVVIRGLSPKYNNVTVNGVQLPATDFNSRATDLNMVSSEMLAGVEVFKSLTPDQDADAIGGSVNFRLAGAPKGFRTQAVIQNGYNDLSGALDQYKGNLTLSNRFFDNRIGVFAQGNLETVDRSSQRIGANYENRIRGNGDTTRVLLTDEVDLRNRAETRNRYGASLMLDYKLPMGTFQLTNFVNRLDRNYLSRDNELAPSTTDVTYEIRDVETTTDVLSTALSGEFNLADRATLDLTLNRSVSILDTPYDSRARFLQKSAFDSTLVRTEGPQAISRSLVNDIDGVFFERLDFAELRGSEKDLGAQGNLKVPFTVGTWLSGNVKTGGKYRTKRRDNDNTQYYGQLYYSNRDTGGLLSELNALFPNAARSSGGLVGIRSFLDANNSDKSILNGGYRIVQAPSAEMIRQAQAGLQDDLIRAAWGDFRDFNAVEDVTAGYVMTELNFGPRVLLLPGVRYERTNTSYRAFFGRAASEIVDIDNQSVRLRDTTSVQTYDDWFPMVQLRVRPKDWFDVRLAYTQTQSRPNFQFTSPQIRISDSGTGLITKGTPELRPAQAENFDAYLSFYSNKIGLFSVGGFYKRIEGVVYQADIRLQDEATAAANGFSDEFLGYRLLEPRNLESPTTVKGVEVEWQANLLWLPGPLSGIVFNANVSRIFSDTQIQRSSQTTVAEPPFFIPVVTYSTYNQDVQLLDQPDWIANLSLGYDRGRFSSRGSMLYQQGNLTGYGRDDGSLAYFSTYLRFDAQASFQLIPQLSLYGQINNLGNRPDLALQGLSRALSEQESYGRSFNIGLRFRP